MEQWRKQTPKPQVAFTIVELLIVIVVIAILATLTIVAYNGIQNGAKSSSLQSDLSQAASLLETSKIKTPGETYPADQAAAIAAGVKASGGNTINYYNNSYSNDYCLESTNSNITYSISSTSTTPINGPCTENSLVGWWPFNGNANDATNVGNNGIVTNASLTLGENGQSNGAYSFDGSTTYITMMKHFMSPDMTISTWYNASVLSQTGHIVYASTGSGDGWGGEYETHLSHQTSGYAFFLHAGDCTNNVSVGAVSSGWHHLVVVLAQGRRIITYLDGVVQVSTPLSCTVDFSAYQETLFIGRPQSSIRYLTGSVDDVRIYNRGLSTNEVTNLYSAGAQ